MRGSGAESHRTRLRKTGVQDVVFAGERWRKCGGECGALGIFHADLHDARGGHPPQDGKLRAVAVENGKSVRRQICNQSPLLRRAVERLEKLDMRIADICDNPCIRLRD